MSALVDDITAVEFDKGSVKPTEEFRNYQDSFRHDIVENHYKLMRTNQSLAFSERMTEKYSFSHPRARMTIKEAFKLLEGYVDSSDPDVDLPNLLHMFQTAEGIRRAGHPDWFQIVGLIHDMGKIMYMWGTGEDGQMGTADGAQWALGGDTWVVGVKIPECVVFPQFNSLNPDYADERYNTENGIYTPGCGINNLKFAFGHDEYLYMMLIANATSLPPPALAMIRLHSLYPWHTGGAYQHFMTEEDKDMMNWVLEFNKFDLYTKDQAAVVSQQDISGLWAYYDTILDKYGLSGELSW